MREIHGYFALIALFVGGCGAKDHDARDDGAFASSLAYSCWDGQEMYPAVAYLGGSDSAIVRYEMKDRNGFVQVVTPENSSDWECNSDDTWETLRRVHEICQDPSNMTDICQAERAGEL